MFLGIALVYDVLKCPVWDTEVSMSRVVQFTLRKTRDCHCI